MIVAGVDFGTLSVRVSIFDSVKGRLGSATGEYPLTRKKEDPAQHVQSLTTATHRRFAGSVLARGRSAAGGSEEGRSGERERDAGELDAGGSLTLEEAAECDRGDGIERRDGGYDAECAAVRGRGVGEVSADADEGDEGKFRHFGASGHAVTERSTGPDEGGDPGGDRCADVLDRSRPVGVEPTCGVEGREHGSDRRGGRCARCRRPPRGAARPSCGGGGPRAHAPAEESEEKPDGNRDVDGIAAYQARADRRSGAERAGGGGDEDVPAADRPVDETELARDGEAGQGGEEQPGAVGGWRASGHEDGDHDHDPEELGDGDDHEYRGVLPGRVAAEEVRRAPADRSGRCEKDRSHPGPRHEWRRTGKVCFIGESVPAKPVLRVL